MGSQQMGKAAELCVVHQTDTPVPPLCSCIPEGRAGPKKANVMDKSADDWSGFKAADSAVQDELHTHSKSADKYLEKKAFLAAAEASDYERHKAGRAGPGR